MAAKDFRCHVIKPDGRQGVEIHSIGNFPPIPPEEWEDFARKTFAKFFPNQQYASVEAVGEDEFTPEPHPGMFPPGLRASERGGT